MKNLLYTLFACSFCYAATAQNFLWAKSFGNNKPDYGSSIARDAEGNIYVAGAFSGTVDFDPGPSVYNLTALQVDGYVLKLDPLGNFIWVKQLVSENTPGASIGCGTITLDNSGNIYLLGSFVDSADFDPGPGSYKLFALPYSQFIEKLDSSGNFTWAKNVRSVGTSLSTALPASIAVDGNGNVYSTGVFEGSCDFDPGPGTYVLYSDYRDPYLLKLNAAGNFQWAKAFDSENAYGTNVVTDANDNVYVAGYFSDTMNLTAATGTPMLLNSGSSFYSDIFLVKFDGGGGFQ